MDQLRRTAVPVQAPDRLAVPGHLASTLRVYIPGAAWLRLRSLQALALNGVVAHRADGAVLEVDEVKRSSALEWITADHPDADWDTDLALDLVTGRLRPWSDADFTAAATVEAV